jgi:photosystem II stability/assembly factor-like uncharacterized protein
MATTKHVTAADGDVLLLIGTMKGAFVLRSSPARTRWQLGGPYFQGQAIYAMTYDGRVGRSRIWAGTGSEHWGPMLCSSDDFGRTWSDPAANPVMFPEGTDAAVKRIWQIHPGRIEEPESLYCGVEPAALFESRDAGESWSLVRGLWDHEHRPKWQPGGGGLCLHTILMDPSDRQRMYVAISTGGVYRTEDGGETWRAMNHGVRADFLPDKHPEFGQCVHKIGLHPSRPETLFLQNHWGLYRSDDRGETWRDIARGVPSDFGFPLAVHPHDRDVVYIVPLESDTFRVTPEAKLRVYRTRDGGGSWEPLTRGLPQKDAHETVLRDALDVDRLNPAGVYFGTRSGQVFGSRDGGASWERVIGGLPPVVCVRAAMVGEPQRGGAKPGARKGGRSARPAAKRDLRERRPAPSGRRPAKKK